MRWGDPPRYPPAPGPMRTSRSWFLFVLAAQFHAAADRQQHGVQVGLGAHLRLVDPGGGTRVERKEHVVRCDEGAGTELWMEELEAGDVQVLPQVEQHQVEGSREAWQRVERAADAKLDEVREPGARELHLRMVDLALRELEAHDLAARRPRGIGEPDRRVAV